ncbi:MAG: hypothetical protein LUF04_03370, partial [Bacteroides sp.]|nr:hypothetical protein [Bacteroides sp.]
LLGATALHASDLCGISAQSQEPVTEGTEMYVQLATLDIIGVEISPCTLIPLGLIGVEIYHQYAAGEEISVEYLCPQDHSEPVYVKAGDTIKASVELFKVSGLKYTKELVVEESDILEGGILKITFLIDIEI